jgi:hypothetical protein
MNRGEQDVNARVKLNDKQCALDSLARLIGLCGKT